MTHQHIETRVGDLFMREDFPELRIRGGLKTEVVFGYNRFTGEPAALHFIWKLMMYSGEDTVLSLRVEDIFRLQQPDTATRTHLVRLGEESLQRFREAAVKEFSAKGFDFDMPDYQVEKGIYEKMLAELKKHRQ